MKTIVKNGKYQRISDLDADIKVKTGWKFCPKSEWKTNIRDIGKSEEEETEKKHEKKH